MLASECVCGNLKTNNGGEDLIVAQAECDGAVAHRTLSKAPDIVRFSLVRAGRQLRHSVTLVGKSP